MTTKAKGITQPIVAIPYTTGSFAFGAYNSQIVLDANVASGSKILIIPTNVDAAALMGSSKQLYVSTRVVALSFTVTTANGVAALGTETFDYIIFN